MTSFSRRWGIAAVVFLAPSLWGAFGQNKVRVDAFSWTVVRSPHFDIYVTPESRPFLPRAIDILEEAHARIPDDLGVPVSERTPVFLFPTHNTFEQNNIVDAVGEGTGGVTEAFKNRLLIFHDGTDAWLRHVLPHEFTHVVEFEALYGGFWRSARLLKSPFYPLWFMEGLAEYESGDVDRVEEEMVLRDAATSGGLFPLTELHGFGHLKPHQTTLAYKEGGAAVRCLAEKHGRESLGAFLKAMRDRFDQNQIIENITGKSFAEFDRAFRSDLVEKHTAAIVGKSEPEADGTPWTLPGPLPVFNTSPALSPDGKELAYVTDKNGSPEVRLRTLATGEEDRVAGVGVSPTEHLSTEARSLAFSPDGRWLAFVGEKEQRDILFLYDVPRRHLRRVRTPFAVLHTPVFHPNGDRLALAAPAGAANDLYEISLRGRVLRRLTDTPEDESHPAYSPDGQRLVFSRETPTALAAPPERQLMWMDLTTGNVSSGPPLAGRETEPVFGPGGNEVFFVGEGEEGVRNLYRWDTVSGAATRLTNTVGGVFSPTFSRDGAVSCFVAYRRTSMHIFQAAPGLWSRVGTVPAPLSPLPEAALPTEMARRAVESERPYRFRASTDLFFPIFYYSSDGGLFTAALWQGSEMLGNHDARVTFQYAHINRMLDYQLDYAYRRFRPEFFLQLSDQSFYRDIERTRWERDLRRDVGVRFPLDRFRRLEGKTSFVRRERRWEDDPSLNSLERDNALDAAWIQDTSDGRYLSVTSGSRLLLGYRWTPGVLKGARDYRTHRLEHQGFFPLGGESALALRARAAVSNGGSPEENRFGGVDRLRGYPRTTDVYAPRYVLLNAEWRTPLSYWKGATVPLMGGFTVKGLYGTLFVDSGVDWGSTRELSRKSWTEVRNSVGGGLGFPSYLFQTFPVWVDFQVAKRTDARFWTVYLSIGPSF